MACEHTYSLLIGLEGAGLGDYRCCAPEGRESGTELSTQDQIVFVRRGVFEKRVGSRRVVATPNTMLLYSVGEEHRTRHPVAGGDDCTVLTLGVDDAREIRVALGIADGAGSPALAPHAWALPAATHVAQWRLLRDAALLLAARPAERWTLAQLAKQTHSSPFHLARVFRREMGMSINRFLNGVRLRGSVHRLALGADDLTALALDLGFSSRGHFFDAFRREFGDAPSRLRAELRGR